MIPKECKREAEVELICRRKPVLGEVESSWQAKSRTPRVVS